MVYKVIGMNMLAFILSLFITILIYIPLYIGMLKGKIRKKGEIDKEEAINNQCVAIGKFVRYEFVVGNP